MSLKVWLRMSWKDTRLAWNPDDFGGLSVAYFQGAHFANDETNEIWIPDVQPYNGLLGLEQVMTPALARVSSDGSVFYSRPGTLAVMCKFSGLVAFPFDALTCPVEFGGWGLSGGQQGIKLSGSGYSFSNQEPTSGTSYQEYLIENVTVTYNNYEYPCCPSEPWPIVMFYIRLSRASSFYYTISLIPGVVITLLSFAIFWTDTASADALGYGISVIIVNLLGNIVLLEILPVCGEVIWIDIFATINTVFCCLSLFQSAFNIMLENSEEDHILPLWIIEPAHYLAHAIKTAYSSGFRVSESAVTQVEPQNASRLLASASAIRESVAGLIYRHHARSARVLRTAERTGSEDSPMSERDRSKQSIEATPLAECARKLMHFERLFFQLDQDASLYIDAEECELLLSYAVLDLDPNARSRCMRRFDSSGDGKLNRVEFCQLCVATVWHLDTTLLDLAIDNMIKARASRKTRNAAYWKRMAQKADTWARVVVPTTYALALLILFNLDMRDGYDTANVEMFQGFGQISMTGSGIAMVVLFCITAIVMLGLWIQVARYAKKKSDELQRRLKLDSTSRAFLFEESGTVGNNIPLATAHDTAGGVEDDEMRL